MSEDEQPQIKVGVWRGSSAQSAWESDDEHAEPTTTRVLEEGDVWVVCPKTGYRSSDEIKESEVVENTYEAGEVVQSAYVSADLSRVYTTIDPIISADESTGSKDETVVRLRVHHHEYPNDDPHDTNIVESDPWEIADPVPGYADYQAEEQGNTLWTRLGAFSIEVVDIADVSSVEPYKVYVGDTYLSRAYSEQEVEDYREKYPDRDIRAEKQPLES